MKTNKKLLPIGHQHQTRRYALKFMTAIAVSAFGAIALNTAYAQSTSSSIVGKAPTDSTITVHSDKGLTRHGSPNSKGRYNLSALLPGTYLVSLEKDGKTLATVQGVPLFASRASEVDFACDNDQCTGSFNH
ncbi:carboxypeptidase-like regulatory domain-containing protein [Dyella koreensis]|uniref:Carboxypeptidase regulatory-like domain-containing protein n=1 Tax=Dyella koreensis TaxID=311235 RepID=A0ABW8K7G0_9GAMM